MLPLRKKEPPCPPPADAAKIEAPLLVHMAGNDNFVNPTWPPFEAALKQAGVNYTAYVYPKTVHGFNNDTTPRYDAEVAARGLTGIRTPGWAARA
jgi:carboxymethylenebutenolidase